MVRTRTAGVGPFKSLTSSLFYRLLNLLSETPVVIGAADYQLLDRVVVNAVLQFKDRYPFVRGLVGWLGFPATKIEYVAPERHRGMTGYTFEKCSACRCKRSWAFPLNPFVLSFYFGLLTAVFCLLYGAFAIVAVGRRQDCAGLDLGDRYGHLLGGYTTRLHRNRWRVSCSGLRSEPWDSALRNRGGG